MSAPTVRLPDDLDLMRGEFDRNMGGGSLLLCEDGLVKVRRPAHPSRQPKPYSSVALHSIWTLPSGLSAAVLVRTLPQLVDDLHAVMVEDCDSDAAYRRVEVALRAAVAPEPAGSPAP